MPHLDFCYDEVVGPPIEFNGDIHARFVTRRNVGATVGCKPLVRVHSARLLEDRAMRTCACARRACCMWRVAWGVDRVPRLCVCYAYATVLTCSKMGPRQGIALAERDASPADSPTYTRKGYRRSW